MAKFKFRKNVNVSRVVSKIVATALALWVGGKIMSAVATSLGPSGTTYQTSAFVEGMKFLGFEATLNSTGGTSGTLGYFNGTVDTTGVVGIIGLIGGATIIMEFVQVSF